MSVSRNKVVLFFLFPFLSPFFSLSSFSPASARQSKSPGTFCALEFLFAVHNAVVLPVAVDVKEGKVVERDNVRGGIQWEDARKGKERARGKRNNWIEKERSKTMHRRTSLN